jgi:hypothetical protein
MNNAVFWVFTSFGSYNNRRFEEHVALIIRMTRISELGTTLAATSNRSTLRRIIITYIHTYMHTYIQHIYMHYQPKHAAKKYQILFAESVGC